MNRLSLVAALFGSAFGFLFSVAGLNQYDAIHRMLLLENLEPFLIMGSAIATALPILWILERRKWRTPLGGSLTLRRSRIDRRHIGGSAVFEAGWAITGACPGTAATTLGAGSVMALVLLLGIVAEISLRDASRPAAKRAGPTPHPATAIP